MAGGEFRFGTASIYMAEAESFGRPVQVTNALLHGYKFRRVEAVFPGIPPIYSNGKSEARFNLAGGEVEGNAGVGEQVVAGTVFRIEHRHGLSGAPDRQLGVRIIGPC